MGVLGAGMIGMIGFKGGELSGVSGRNDVWWK